MEHADLNVDHLEVCFQASAGLPSARGQGRTLGAGERRDHGRLGTNVERDGRLEPACSSQSAQRLPYELTRALTRGSRKSRPDGQLDAGSPLSPPTHQQVGALRVHLLTDTMKPRVLDRAMPTIDCPTPGRFSVSDRGTPRNRSRRDAPLNMAELTA
mgnify:CR=1 FL=1